MAYPGSAPFGRDDVLGQQVYVYKRHWISAVPQGAWPEALNECPQDGRGRLHVSRQAVFDVASQAATNPTAANCEQTLVAVDAWGTGTSWRSVKRAQRAWLGSSGDFPTQVGVRLKQAVAELLHGGGPIAAYELLRHGTGHVDGLGPAFFTKFLYFVGYNHASGELKPLLLDRYVARGLNRIRGSAWADSGWSADQYGEYLAWAKAEVHSPGPILSEDEAEYRIWWHGKSRTETGLR